MNKNQPKNMKKPSERDHYYDEEDDNETDLVLEIEEFEPNPEDQILLELSKQKTVVEIDQKFALSRTNQTYVFPRVAVAGSANDDSDSDELSDCTFYNLNSQPTSKMHEKIKRYAATADQNKSKLIPSQNHHAAQLVIRNDQQKAILSNKQRESSSLNQSQSNKQIDNIDADLATASMSTVEKDSNQTNNQKQYYNIQTTISGNGRARKMKPPQEKVQGMSTGESASSSEQIITSAIITSSNTAQGFLVGSENKNEQSDLNSPSKLIRDEGKVRNAIKIAEITNISAVAAAAAARGFDSQNEKNMNNREDFVSSSIPLPPKQAARGKFIREISIDSVDPSFSSIVGASSQKSNVYSGEFIKTNQQLGKLSSSSSSAISQQQKSISSSQKTAVKTNTCEQKGNINKIEECNQVFEYGIEGFESTGRPIHKVFSKGSSTTGAANIALAATVAGSVENAKKKSRMKIVVVGMRPNSESTPIASLNQPSSQTVQTIVVASSTSRNEIGMSKAELSAQHYSLSPFGSQKKRKQLSQQNNSSRGNLNSEIIVSSTSSNSHQFPRELAIDSSRPVKTDGNDDEFREARSDLNQRRLGSGDRFYRHPIGSSTSKQGGNSQKALQKNKSIHTVVKVTAANAATSISGGAIVTNVINLDEQIGQAQVSQLRAPSSQHLYSSALNGYSQIQRTKKPQLLGNGKSRSEENRIMLKVTSNGNNSILDPRRKLGQSSNSNSEHRNLQKSTIQQQFTDGEASVIGTNIKSNSAKLKAVITNSHSGSGAEVLGGRKISGIRINMKPSTVMKKSVHSLQGQPIDASSAVSSSGLDVEIFDEEQRWKMKKKSEQLNQILIPHANRSTKQSNFIELLPSERIHSLDGTSDIFKSNVSSTKASTSHGHGSKPSKLWLSNEQMNASASNSNGYSWMPQHISSTKSSHNNSNQNNSFVFVNANQSGNLNSSVHSMGQVMTAAVSVAGSNAGGISIGGNSLHSAYNPTLSNGKSPIRNYLIGNNNHNIINQVPTGRQTSKQPQYRAKKSSLNTSMNAQNQGHRQQQVTSQQPIQQQNFILNFSSYS